MEQWLPVLSILAVMAPGVIAYLSGAVVSTMLWRRYPRPCLLLLIVCLGLLALTLLQAVLQGWYYPTLMANGHLSSSQMAFRFAVFGIANSVLHACLFGLLIWAVFAGRRKDTE